MTGCPFATRRGLLGAAAGLAGVKIFDRMSKFDMLNQFVTHVGGGLFACPPGIPAGRYLAQDLFEAA